MSERLQRREQDEDPINWTRTDDGVEIYDETNPDAWVRMEFVSGIAPEKRLYGVCDDCGLVTAQRALPSASMACGNCGAEFGDG
ncbi:hypothetical protein [Halorussus salinus]|uniref:hypothetical protein n=1 Tax=Halorussus salinus TaxID=1364935 RepID=UPI0010932865|nr:hypothetical protein [Halorussus salinus]